MTSKRQPKKWTDHNGQEIPAQYVPKLDKERDRVAQKLHKRAVTLNKQIAAYKNMALAEADEIFEAMLEKHDSSKDHKGNYTITSFDKTIKIEVNVKDRIEFTDEIQVAQLKINEFLAMKIEGADADLQEIVNNAFRTTKGRLDTKRVLSLFSYKIKHAKWLEAMEAIKSSITKNSSKRYMRIFKKDDSGEYKSLDLNFSSI